VYSNNPYTLDEVKKRIRETVTSVVFSEIRVVQTIVSRIA
jgi:hypothetical protein